MLRRRVNVSRSVTEGKRSGVGGTPKTWERRSVPFPASLADELSALMIGKGRDELVFTNLVRRRAAQHHLPGRRCSHPLSQKCQRVDYKPSRRSRRTTCATRPRVWRCPPGANVKAVQRMLGHAKASMTLDVYADLFDEDLDEGCRPAGLGDHHGTPYSRHLSGRAAGPARREVVADLRVCSRPSRG